MTDKIFKLEDLPEEYQKSIKQICKDLKEDQRFSIGVGEAKDILYKSLNSMFVNSYRNIEI